MRELLRKNWFLISSDDINESGEAISRSGYSVNKWCETEIPNTVISALTEKNIYGDPYYGLNMTKIDGYKKRRDINFSLQPKPKDSPFRKSWWYRTEFDINSHLRGKQIWLNFRGINYSANIWLNGKMVAGADYVEGTFRLYDFNVTDFIIFGEKNALAVEVFSPKPNDLAITFIDWSPGMSDDNMGIWQPVILYSTGSLALKNTFVNTKVKTDTLKEAELTIETEIVNTWNETVKARIECEIKNIKFGKEIKLGPLSTKKIVLNPRDFPDLKIKNPHLWWPYQLGKPELYTLKMVLKNISGDKERDISDVKEVTFGIREIKTIINKYKARLFIINGKKVLIRGAAWSPDLMLRQEKRRDEIDTDFVVNLNLNTIRLEGKLATDYFWDLCDRKGLLVIAGWPCCNHFEKWNKWKHGDINVARDSELSQILRLRNHPSFAAWLYGSDFAPPENVEKVYLEVLDKTYKNLPRISSAAHKSSKLTGISGVKMTGPYTYVPPVYWYDKERAGYAEHFNTETCPDVCIPIMESIKKMIPSEQLFVGSEAWNHHAGVAKFKDTKVVDGAISQRYGKPLNISDYSKTAQVLSYECWRAMYEAHNRNFPQATGIIGWMLNSPWPSLIWQLYDYYMNPVGSYFAAKKACELLHIQYSYDDRSIWIINNGQADYPTLVVSAKIYDFSLEEKLLKEVDVEIKSLERKKIFILPEISGLSKVYFLRLELKNGKTVKSRQLYWLPKERDIFIGRDLWYNSPLKKHADLSLIRKMPVTHIDVVQDIKNAGRNFNVTVDIKNSGNYLAFFVWVKLFDKKTDEIISPVFWSDNCVFLFPGEELRIKGVVPSYFTDGKLFAKVEGWNC
ncbi:MAG: glycoside hydrolase family 2 protein [Actinomycetota bacterium]|nr:glycoside hydrolase family 2 protein [Actinomycetota bacterium]